MDILTYVLLASTLFMLIYFGLSYLFKGRRTVKDRLYDIESITSEEDFGPDISTLTGNIKKNEEVYNLPIIGPYIKKTSDRLLQAHIMIKPTEYFLFSLLSAAIFFFLFFALTKNPLIAILPAVLGFFLPSMYVGSARDKRARKLNNQLPEFLNILSNALRAGLSFNQAIATAGSEMEDPIKWEFQKVMRDNNLGRPLENALDELVKRTGDEDIEMLVSAIVIQRQVGGNLSEVLDLIANTIRERVKLKGEVRTLSAQSRMSAVIIGVLPIAIGFIISVINPGYLKPLFTETMGRLMLGTAGAMIIIGAIILKRIVNLEV
ncbi:MAG: type II secretion system F family protein [Clostridiaceae bacterium]